MAPKKKSSIEQTDMGDLLLGDSVDGAGEAPSKENLGKLSNMVKNLLIYVENIERTEEVLKELCRNRDKIQMESIPDLFDELSMSKFVLDDGTGVEVKRGFVGSVTEETRLKAFKWLEKNGHDAIIKHDFTVKLKKGEKEQAKEIREDLELLDVPYSEKEHIHPQTLKAFINEQMENGADIPQDAFNIFPIRKAIIKK